VGNASGPVPIQQSDTQLVQFIHGGIQGFSFALISSWIL